MSDSLDPEMPDTETGFGGSVDSVQGSCEARGRFVRRQWSSLLIQFGVLVLCASAVARVVASEMQPPPSAVTRPCNGQSDRGSGLQCPEQVGRAYAGRHGTIWLREGNLSDAATRFLELLTQAPDHGLRSSDYHLQTIDALRREDAADRFERDKALDVLLTDAFFLYLSHLADGRLNPAEIEPDWKSYRDPVDYIALLETASRYPDGVDQAMDAVLPVHPGYDRLRRALRVFREATAARIPWDPIPRGPSLRVGDDDQRVVAVRSRLFQTRDLDSSEARGEPSVFDDDLEQAVKRFQRRHGLVDDGVVGKRTIVEMNYTPQQRMAQLMVNLERWRWAPRDPGERYILVNTPAFELQVMEQWREVLSMPVVVGKDYRRTPVFRSEITYIVTNPRWHIPRRIAIEDILPRVWVDPDYLTDRNIGVYLTLGGKTVRMDPKDVDWLSLHENNFPYRLVQEPGPTNPLGKVKFMFPNAYDVYLHDSPERWLFNYAVRDFSSGCVRLSDAQALLSYLVQCEGDCDLDAVTRAQRENKERRVNMKKPIPIYLDYRTAWVDADGDVHFRPDLYGRDERLVRVLEPS